MEALVALLSGASRGDARDVQGRERATAPEPEAAQSSTEASSRPGEHASTSQAAQRSLVSGPGEVLRRLELRPVPAPAEFGSEATHTRLANIAAVDLQGLLEVSVPFLVLFLVVFVVQQFWGLIQYGIVFVSVSGSTLHLQRLVGAQQDTKLYKVLDVLSIVLLNVWALSVMGLPDEEMLRNVTLRPPLDRLDIWQCLYYAMVSPLIVKQWMIVPKVLTVLLFVGESGSAAGMRRQAAVLTFLEYFCVAWTEAMPTVIWFGFFLSCTSDMIVCAILTGWYLALKTHGYLRHASNLGHAALLVFSGRAQHGTAPVQEEVLETGNQCPICQDALKSPLKLDCGHIYCDDCIGEWLERERTCPMCRKVVRNAGLQSYGNGATSFMPNPF